MPKWESNTVAKIHDGCGGLVRWVEAHDTPHVGYYGACLACHAERLVVEDILPVEAPADAFATAYVDDVDRDALAALDWDDDADWEANQQRLREAIEE